MPGTRCAVYGCNNNLLAIKAKGENVTFHVFPRQKDLISKSIGSEWINRWKSGDKFNPDTSRICSVHFVQSDYERDLQNELLGLLVRKILKKTAIPTLNLPDRMNPTVTERERRSSKRKQKEEVNDLLTNNGNNSNNLQDEYHYEIKYKKLLEEYNVLKSEYEKLKEDYKKRIKVSNDLLRYYKRRNIYRPNLRKSSQITTDLLTQVFTKSQISLLSKKKKRVNWNTEDMSIALTLRYYSKKCYLYLKNKLHYPLPCVSSLKKWASRVNLRQGILKDVLLMLKLAGENCTPFEKNSGAFI
ncbi:uncharacterized protein [Centruroides vittatus]|uniref:uncharacterized protein n=1 Tax=Centruroides vittatus TaxID=120091 RepID=UPI00350F67D6